MRVLKTFGENAKVAEDTLQQLEQRGAANTAKVDGVVREILAAVRERGDAALHEYTARFDGLAAEQPLLVSREEMQSAWEATSEELKAAMRLAQANIRTFAEKQLPRAWSFRPSEGMEVGQIVRPLSSVGCYVPGGRYPLPSTLLMTVTPAQVAGVERIVVCSPKPARETMAAAYLAGVTEFYRVGGAQAIAAMAFGTATIAAVDKIVGPGNLYVTAAKIAVSQETGIDMPAGPTEIVVTSENGDPSGIAADLVAQAEHDPEALAVLITSKHELAEEVALETKRQAQGNEIAQASLAAQGFAFVTKTVEEAQALTNRLAPEHLTVDAGADLRWVKNAGSVFVGHHTPQSMGDYISGPNHVLPTGRNGRVRGGLSVFDFVKVITVQQYTRDALREVGPHTIALAEAEGLAGHAESVRVRMR
ncbi:histidinol dehydrogenase [Granulicella mallensis]|uniref:Histidinol dehydrogenase n=1 Tax=Granulicella mallensis (strain ATCC BAA-1857 / DSM 23137 / MP5ACTX8) TaxID=682795 RepID=G8NV68_GRAMM|nr:histidinol dehydrogenase [Granulicella mallensis]AEU35357.1 histidinol dehydrogenase [Granulicella mallensis MP5ACTX8]